jgi:hypothetical protein
MIVQRTVSSRSGAQKTAPQLPKLLHELLHNCFPERPETHKNHFEAPILHNNIRKVGSFRNRQVSGSSPLAGSILNLSFSLLIPAGRAESALVSRRCPEALRQGFRLLFFLA